MTQSCRLPQFYIQLVYKPHLRTYIWAQRQGVFSWAKQIQNQSIGTLQHLHPKVNLLKGQKNINFNSKQAKTQVFGCKWKRKSCSINQLLKKLGLAACREGEFVKALLAFSKKFFRHHIQTKWYQNRDKADLKLHLDFRYFWILRFCEIFTVVANRIMCYYLENQLQGGGGC